MMSTDTGRDENYARLNLTASESCAAVVKVLTSASQWAGLPQGRPRLVGDARIGFGSGGRA
jgi:hypothetical protein